MINKNKLKQFSRNGEITLTDWERGRERQRESEDANKEFLLKFQWTANAVRFCWKQTWENVWNERKHNFPFISIRSLTQNQFISNPIWWFNTICRSKSVCVPKSWTKLAAASKAISAHTNDVDVSLLPVKLQHHKITYRESMQFCLRMFQFLTVICEFSE